MTRRKLKAAQVAAQLKLPEHWVRSRAMALGLAISHRRMPPWSEEEDNYICENRHLHYDVLRNRLKNRGWYRSSGAILNRLYQLGQSTQRTGNSYSIHYLASLLGVTEKTIGRWVRLGWLPAKARSPGKNHHGAPVEYAITPQAVRKFLITHTHYVDISQADKHWLISLLAGEETSCLRQTQCGTSHEAANGYDEHTVQV